MNINPEYTVDHVVRTILSDLLAKIEVSAQQVLIGTDPDDIHDLRVATRRTRTVLGQMPGVFQKTTIRPFQQGFRRIGDITGACRDLDVWLDAIDENQGLTDTSDANRLESLNLLVRRHRDEARAQVIADLELPWFAALLSQWKTFLDTPPETLPEKATRKIAPVAAARILKAHQRLLKHGNALPEAPMAAQFHRLRIDGKKLRYLLEFFGGLFDPEQSNHLIEDLKRLQDVLGGINDRKIQLKALSSLEESSDPAVALAVDRHRQFLQDTLEVFHCNFAAEFRAFADPEVTQSFWGLFGP
ncbi:MAG: hypothetical protein DRJ61_14710 [Acidobacteria bacterium]|nr:MAG: hypothetical protein DRJ65_18630 [Acidobacteriota bacterium]RLE29358.1 MAG: hypothetical protein DRJ61_14710 [Acidobacteriota bacterium]